VKVNTVKKNAREHQPCNKYGVYAPSYSTTSAWREGETSGRVQRPKGQASSPTKYS